MTNNMYFTSATNTVQDSKRTVVVDDVKCYCWGVRGLAVLLDSLDCQPQLTINLLKTLTKERLVPSFRADANLLHNRISLTYLLSFSDSDSREYDRERLIELRNVYTDYLNMCDQYHRDINIDNSPDECISVLLMDVKRWLDV